MFEHIVPCGIRDRGVTSMAQAARRGARDARGRRRVVARFAESFELRRGRPPRRRVARRRRRPRAVHRGGADAGVPVRLLGRLAEAGVPRRSIHAARRPEWMKVRARFDDEYLGLEEARARSRPPHGVRRSRVPEHLRVLGRPHGHVHDPRRSLHARVRVLPGRHAQAARGRCRRTRAGSPKRCARSGSRTSSSRACARDDLRRRWRVRVRGDGRRGERR